MSQVAPNSKVYEKFFDAHGIRHFSASALNKWIGSPAAYGLSYLKKVKEPTNPAMARGTHAESGIVAGLLDHKRSIESCVDLALAGFDKDMALNPTNPDKIEMERKRISDLVGNGIIGLRKYGTPDFQEGNQQFVKVNLDGVAVPLIGYLDLFYPEHGLIIDIKTTARMPSSISAAHARQGAGYAAAMANHEIRFAYVTPKDCKVLRQEDTSERLTELTKVAQQLQHFLSQSEDTDELLRLLTPDYSSFYFSSPTMREAGREVWGF